MSLPVPSVTGADPVGAGPPTGPEEAGVSLGRATWRRLRRTPTAWVGAAIIVLFVLVAVAAPVLTPYAPASTRWAGEVSTTSVPGPSAEHWLGLDRYGADMATQLLYGARTSLLYGVVSTLIGLLAGAALGALAGGAGAVGGRIGSWVDATIMRLVDVMLAVPSLLLAVSIAAVLGKSGTAIVVAIGAAQVPVFARLLRSSMLAQAGADYVLAANALGLRRSRIVMSHLLPNSVGPTIVQATLNLATAIIEVAALSYLGLGTPEVASAEWGRMLVAAQERFEQAPRLALLPGVAIAVTALGFTLLGEALREALDPRSRR